MTRLATLSEIAQINPPMPRSVRERDSETLVPFLPMAAVREDGTASYEQQRPLSELLKGFTYFERGDVLLAKITPCFENGKAVELVDLPFPFGFGSTEFHVLRAGPEVDSHYLFHAIWNPGFRRVGERRMTGTAGQKRVPTSFLESFRVSLPPLAEQGKLVAALKQTLILRKRMSECIDQIDLFRNSLVVHGSAVIARR